MLKASKDHLLYEVDEATGKLVGDPVCEECSVCQRVANLLSGVITLWIELWVRGTRKSFKMDRNKLFNGGFKDDLTDQGLTLPPNEPEVVAAIRDHLIESDINADEVYTHDRLGFYELNGKTVFLANEVIGDCKKASHYFKPAITAPKGTLEAWLSIINKDIIGHPNMELALAIGISAPVAHLLQKAKLIVEVPIWSLVGESSTGKTTSVRLMASIYGSPEEGSGLIQDFHATDTALFATLQNCGTIHILDESTIVGKKDRSDMIYSLSKSMKKLRCNPDGSLKERRTFSGTVVITGEQSLLENSTANLGLYARVVELTLPWTDDADHARRISQGFRANYGTAIVPYAEHLLTTQEKRPDVLEKGFRQELEKFRAKISTASGVEDRLLSMYATVTLSARIFNKALGVNLDVPGMRDLLAEAHRKAPHKGDLAQELYDTIFDEVALHGQYFPTTSGKRKNEINPFSMWGEQTTLQGKEVLWIAGRKFQEFAGQHGFGNPTPYLRELHKQGLVKQYSDGFTTKHKLGENQVRCYCFYKT